MKLRQLLFERSIKQSSIIRRAAARGAVLNTGLLSLVVRGMVPASARMRLSIKASLVELGIDARTVEEVEELRNLPDRL